MSRRRTESAAQAAADQASAAARVLQERSQQAREQSRPEPTAEPESSPEPRRGDEEQPDTLSTERIQELRNANPRDRILEELANREAPKPPEKAAPEPQAAPEQAQPPAEPDPAAETAPAGEEPQPETAKTVRVKVDGEEFDVPQEDIEEAGGTRAYRIQRAAENRLAKANEALAEIRATQAETLKNAAPQKPQESDAQFIASKMDTMRLGTPEEGAAAWLEIQQRLQPKTIDHNALVEQAANRIKHDQAVAEFDKEFADLVSNPIILGSIVSLRNQRMTQLKGQVDWGSFYRKIGTEVRSAFGRQSQPAPAVPAATVPAATSGNPSQAPSDREARKASIVNLPTAAARAALPAEDKPETRQDILNEMRKSRGIPVG